LFPPFILLSKQNLRKRKHFKKRPFFLRNFCCEKSFFLVITARRDQLWWNFGQSEIPNFAQIILVSLIVCNLFFRKIKKTIHPSKSVKGVYIMCLWILSVLKSTTQLNEKLVSIFLLDKIMVLWVCLFPTIFFKTHKKALTSLANLEKRIEN